MTTRLTRRQAASALVALLSLPTVLPTSPALAEAPSRAPRPRRRPARPTRFRTAAPNAIIIDFKSGEALYRKESSRAIPPASMTKLMTLYMAFETLASGDLALDSPFVVSQRAAAAPGSSMLLKAGERVAFEDLIRGAAIHSGNDAAITLAEGLAGDEAVFATVMTLRAQKMGLSSANFENATGLPHARHRISVADLARLSERLIRDFPDRVHYFAEQRFTWNGVTQANRNPLLGEDLGVDGLKTGHTNAAGYCISLSAQRDGRRVVVVLAGLESEEARAREGRRALDWAYEVGLAEAGAPGVFDDERLRGASDGGAASQ